MRVTNSMLVNNFMRNLNTNMEKMDKLQNQLATGRKYAHISDDPMALIFGMSARNKIARLEHYQRTVGSAQDWLHNVETNVMELQGRVADIYNEVVNAATDVKGNADKNDIAMLIAQLRDHYVDTLNATFGDKYVFAGYNTPGDSTTGKITGPFTIDEEWNLHYDGGNIGGFDLSDFLRISVDGAPVLQSATIGMFDGLKLDITKDIPDILTDIDDAITQINTLVAQLDPLNSDLKAKNEELSAIRISISSINSVIERLDGEMMDLPDNFPNLETMRLERAAKVQELADKRQEELTAQDELGVMLNDRDKYVEQIGKYINTDSPKYDSFDRVTLSVGGIALLEVDNTVSNIHEIDAIDPGSITEFTDKINLMRRLQGDVMTFDVGPAVSMAVTFNGIDLVLYQASDGTTLNIFNVLHEVYKAASSGAPADEIGSFISELQDAQNHLLTKVAEVGGRTRRLDLLEARYEQNAIMYEQMKSDAEDVDMAEVIMYQKMAEAVYQAALSAGARIIRPTLMDFLR